MAQAQKTVTVESVLTHVRIDPVGQRLVLEGVIRVVGSGQIVATFTEDVTASMDATDLTAATRLVNRSQTWIDSKLAAL